MMMYEYEMYADDVCENDVYVVSENVLVSFDVTISREQHYYQQMDD